MKPSSNLTLWSRVAWSLLGLVSLALVGSIPFIGGFVWLAAIVFGIGAVVVRGGQALAGRRRLHTVSEPYPNTLSSADT